MVGESRYIILYRDNLKEYPPKQLTNNLILSSLEYGSENSFFNITIDSEQVLSLFCVSLLPQDMLHHFLKRGKKEENWVWEEDSSRRILFFFSLNLQIFLSIFLKKFTSFINQLATLDVDIIKSHSIQHYPPITMKLCDGVKNIHIGKQRTILSDLEINEKSTISKGKISLSFNPLFMHFFTINVQNYVPIGMEMKREIEFKEMYGFGVKNRLLENKILPSFSLNFCSFCLKIVNYVNILTYKKCSDNK